MPYASIIYAKKDHVASVILNRAESDNTIDQQMARELEDVCLLINQDDDIYVVIITGAGDKSFCCGEATTGERHGSSAAAIAAIDRPVIAAMNGDALAEGLELALSCDIRLAAETARFGLPQVARGRIPTSGGTQRLPRIVGKGKALELLLTAESISAAEALYIGLVSRIAPAKEIPSTAETLAAEIAAKGPLALRYIKEAVNKGLDLTLEKGLRLEADLYFLLHTTSDRTEGIKSFLGKRLPRFRGE
jgi:enoyl-CoA hydratase/carnithine racemase